VGQDEILDGEAAESAHLVEEELCIVGAIEDDMDVGADCIFQWSHGAAPHFGEFGFGEVELSGDAGGGLVLLSALDLVSRALGIDREETGALENAAELPARLLIVGAGFDADPEAFERIGFRFFGVGEEATGEDKGGNTVSIPLERRNTRSHAVIHSSGISSMRYRAFGAWREARLPGHIGQALDESGGEIQGGAKQSGQEDDDDGCYTQDLGHEGQRLFLDGSY
jgi:hypothetical protein